VCHGRRRIDGKIKVARSPLRPSFCEPQCSHLGQQRGFLFQASTTEFCSSALLLLSLILSTAVMPCFVLSIVFAVAATATLLHDISLAPASCFAGHNNSQVPTAARDVFNRLLNRQVTCDPGYGLCLAAAAQRLRIAAPTLTSVSRLVECAAATTSTPVRRTGTVAGAIAR
jgi:hypothetical protein